MKLPKLRLPVERRAEFEKRLVIWTIMRDIFGGWEQLAEHLECRKYIRKSTKRINKKRLCAYMLRTVFLDLHQETGLEW